MSAFATVVCLLSNIASAGSFEITYETTNVMEAGPKLYMGKAIYGVETFDHVNVSNGSYKTNFGTARKITGTYTGLTLKNADKYGGAKATGKYAVTSNKAGYTLELSKNGVPGVNYFGFWLSALDANNQLEFYRGDVKVGSYKPKDLIKALGSCDGASDKAPKPHCGNPSMKNKNLSQQYAFVNFYYTGGYFDKVKFYQSGGGGYESDNHTVAYCSNIKACMSGAIVTKEDVPTEAGGHQSPDCTEIAAGSSETSVNYTPWKMAKGDGIIAIKKTAGMVNRTEIDQLKGKSSKVIAKSLEPYFDSANIPVEADRWTPVSLETKDGKEYFYRQMNAGIRDCRSLESAQYNYFETYVNIPEQYELDKFSISFANSDMDDASRITIFNDQYKNGIVVPGSYVPLQGNGTSDLKDYVVAGRNRIVVTNLDNCANITVPKINVVLNGSIVEEVGAVPCGHVEAGDGVTDGASDRMIRTSDGRQLPANNFIEYRGTWEFSNGGPSAQVRDSNLVFYFPKPIDGKSGHYCYSLGTKTPACDTIRYHYTEPGKVSTWAVNRLALPNELLLFSKVDDATIKGKYWPNKNDNGKTAPAATITMKVVPHP